MRTKIEWTDYSCNCFWGCRKGCSYCAAKRCAKRFAERIGKARGYSPEIIKKMKDFEPIFLIDQLVWIAQIKKPSRIFMSFMGEPFSPEFEEYLPIAFRTMGVFPEHTFITLTKQPQNLIKWSPFPDNCWVGVSVCNDKMLDTAVDKLEDTQAKIKFISFEPLLARLTLSLDYAFYYSGISWVIIGAQTPYSEKTAPRIEWVQEILVAASNAGNIPVFMKNNLQPVIDHDSLWTGWKLRQEFPVTNGGNR